jgi:hypothetical protein
VRTKIRQHCEYLASHVADDKKHEWTHKVLAFLSRSFSDWDHDKNTGPELKGEIAEDEAEHLRFAAPLLSLTLFNQQPAVVIPGELYILRINRANAKFSYLRISCASTCSKKYLTRKCHTTGCSNRCCLLYLQHLLVVG